MKGNVCSIAVAAMVSKNKQKLKSKSQTNIFDNKDQIRIEGLIEEFAQQQEDGTYGRGSQATMIISSRLNLNHGGGTLNDLTYSRQRSRPVQRWRLCYPWGPCGLRH
jgi:hypothetical protein